MPADAPTAEVEAEPVAATIDVPTEEPSATA